MRTENSATKTSSRKTWSQLFLYGIVAIIVFGVDQITKAIMVALASRRVGIPGIVTLHSVTNDGAAFSLGRGNAILFLIIAAVVIGLLTWYLRHFKPQNKLLLIGAGLIAGGALGNALDRLLTGSVVDFISLDCIHFPVFNVADAAITCGFALIIFVVARHGESAIAPHNKRKP